MLLSVTWGLIGGVKKTIVSPFFIYDSFDDINNNYRSFRSANKKTHKEKKYSQVQYCQLLSRQREEIGTPFDVGFFQREKERETERDRKIWTFPFQSLTPCDFTVKLYQVEEQTSTSPPPFFFP